jgi:ankyrin repeat protein
MVRPAVVLASLLLSTLLRASEEKLPSYPYQVARAHEIKPHRHNIPFEGVRAGFNQLRLTLTVSPTGDVIDASAAGDSKTLAFWPQVQGEVRQWKFTPFEKRGEAVTAEVEEYITFVPPERLPKTHVAAPAVGPNSKVTITLERSGCFGACPAYSVTVSTDGIVFDGSGFVAAQGKHTDRVDADDVRRLARKFVAANFYSMDASYRAAVTDMPGYQLSLTIDGHAKDVTDYVGAWVGMPAAISELENDVDSLARTQRWIQGEDGLVQALQAEKFNFRTFQAQVMLKEAASRGTAATVREFLNAGVPLSPRLAQKPGERYMAAPVQAAGWLNAASSHPAVLRLFIGAGASQDDQNDKDLALAGAARSGNIDAARALIAYGANPNAGLGNLILTETIGGMAIERRDARSVLMSAAESGNPEMVSEILRYHPKLETRDGEGKTAVFAAGQYRNGDEEGARVKCLRLLAKAGANVNARDNQGNTPLHETFLTDVEEELLKLGANVNARNKDGETPIFTTFDDDAIPLFLAHGADLTIRNNKGETVIEAAKTKGPFRQEALRKAIEKSNRR